MKSLSDRSCCVLLGFADCVAALQPQVWLSSYPTCRGNGNMRTCGGAAHFCKLLVSFECSVFDCKLWARRGGNVCASHFCFVLVVGLMTVDACQASFSTKHGDKTNKSTGKSREQDFVVSGNTALFQFLVILLVPPSMHLITLWRGPLKRTADFDDWVDWFLSSAIIY